MVAEVGDDCVGCGECVDKCQFHAITLEKDAGRAQINFKRCMGCGVCEDQCPTDAITMLVELAKGRVFDLEELKKAL